MEEDAGPEGGGRPRAESVLGISLSNLSLVLVRLGRPEDAASPAAKALKLMAVHAQPALAGKTSDAARTLFSFNR